MRTLNFVCTTLPGPQGECQFVELEDETGASVSVGEWCHREDGLVELAIDLSDFKEWGE